MRPHPLSRRSVRLPLVREIYYPPGYELPANDNHETWLHRPTAQKDWLWLLLIFLGSMGATAGLLLLSMSLFR
jgi:hypothetical protein